MSLGWSRIAVAVGMQRRKAAWQAAVLALVLGLAGVSMADPAQVGLGRAAFGGNVESVRLVVAHEAVARDVPVDSKNESQSSTAADAAACVELARSGRWKEIRSDEAGSETQNVTQDPRDIWNFQEGVLEQDIQERVIRIQNQRYVLGVWSGKPHWVFIDDYPYSGPTPPDVQARIDYEMSHPKQKKGPVYLARVGADGVATIVCEFKSTWHWWFNQYRVMTLLERLQVRARRESLALSQVAVKVPGLWGVQALSEASPKSGIGLSSFSLEARERFLQDAIESHRDDILRFYLNHIVDLDAAPVKHPTGHTRVEASEGIETVEWLGDLKYAAITHGTPDSIRQLLAHGADPNLPTVVFDVVGDVVDRKPLAEAWLAGFHQLFLHGADPNPVISAVVEKYARPREREDLVIRAERTGVDASAASGPTQVPVESLFNDALAFRDAPDCGPGESSTRLAICLPNTLKHANAAFVPVRKNDLFAELNRKCDVRLIDPYTHAGWLSYVLSEQSRALCVIDALRGWHDAR